MKLITLLLMLGAPLLMHAQNSILETRVTWSSESRMDLNTQEIFSTDAAFISDSTKIELHRKGIIQTFIITGTTGEWNDVGLPGTILFEASYADAPCSIEITRALDGTYIIVDLSSASSSGLKQKFFVSKIEQQP